MQGPQLNRKVINMSEQNDLWIVTTLVDSGDPAWKTATTIVATPERMAELFDLNDLPFGAKLLKGAAARKFLQRAVRHEKRFQRELAFKRKAGGRN
jgi:hypothetical protein